MGQRFLSATNGKPRIAAAGVAITVVVAGLFALRPSGLALVDDRICDLLTGWPEPGKSSGQIVLVEIDDESLKRFGRWPWPRDLLARLVDRVADAKASMAVLDITLSDPGEDEHLARSLGRLPAATGYVLRFDAATAKPECSPPDLPLVVGAAQTIRHAPFFRASTVECSVPGVARASSTSGFLNAAPDSDGRIRTVPLIVEQGGRYLPSLSLAAVTAYNHVGDVQLRVDEHGGLALRLDGRVVRLEGNSAMRVRWREPRSFPSISAARVLTSPAPTGMLSGRIALIGVSAYGLPSASGAPAYTAPSELVLQATAIDNLLLGDVFHRPPEGRGWEFSVAMVAGLASVVALTLIHSLWATLVTGALVIAVWTGCFIVLSTAGVLLSPLPATGTLAVNFLALMFLNYLREQKRAEQSELKLLSANQKTEKLRQISESRYQQLVENVSDAIITDDIEGKLVFANRRFREWFGLQDRDVRGSSLEDYVAPEYRNAVREQHRLRIAGQLAQDHMEYEGLRADGSRMWLEAQITTVTEDGQIVGTQSALRDGTERRRLEAQYLQAQKLESVGRLAGGVAHDFNNLLMVINGYTEMVAARVHDDRELLDMVQEIQSAGERAAELTMQLLTFSRKQVAQRRLLDLNTVVSEAQKMLTRLVGENIIVESCLAPSPALVVADFGQMQQVLMNLVVNARDSMPDGGTLTIETRNIEVDDALTRRQPELSSGWYVYMRVTDTGIGMTEEIKRQIFEPFFTTKEKGKGTGLGLATVHSIVRQSEGSIWAESEPGLGTTFHVYLPWAQEVAQAATVEGKSITVPSGSETVLLVEDQDAVREVIGRSLRLHGYHVLHAADGRSAIALAANYRAVIDLLITDVILPQMNGRVLAETLTQTRPEMKVLYVSGYSEDIVAHQGVLDSGLSYLAKPFSANALMAKIRETLGHGKTIDSEPHRP